MAILNPSGLRNRGAAAVERCRGECLRLVLIYCGVTALLNLGSNGLHLYLDSHIVGTGGLSGPCVKPVALRMVYEVAHAVSVPVIGLGGISCATDAIEFLLAGASAIEIGTHNFVDPTISVKVAEGINEYLDRHGYKSVQEIVGIVE